MQKAISILLYLVFFSQLVMAYNQPITVSIQETTTRTESRNIFFILDGSGSMWQKVDGEFKIVLARDILSGLVLGLPDTYKVGLVVYGHREKSDCGDIETLISLSTNDPERFESKIGDLNPLGKTPISAAVRHAIASLGNDQEECSIVLISDGLETCGGDPCMEVRMAREKNEKLVFNVVGFGLEDDDVSSLECAAQEGGGLYFDARDASQLADALRRVVVEEPVMAESFLSVKAMKNDKLVDVMVKVYESGTRNEVVFGRTYVTPNTNPRVLGLPSGTYDIVVRSLHLKGDVSRSFKGVSLLAGDTLFKSIDFSPGSIEVTVTRNGDLSDAVVSVLGVGDGKEVAKTRTYRTKSHNPARFELTPGQYDISVKSVEIKSSPDFTFTNVEVKTEEKTTMSHDFKSGMVHIGARSGKELLDMVIYIYDTGSGKEIARGRTYVHENSNPKEFILPTGTYRVTMKAIKKEYGKKEFEIIVEAGQDKIKIIEF